MKDLGIFVEVLIRFPVHLQWQAFPLATVKNVIRNLVMKVITMLFNVFDEICLEVFVRLAQVLDRLR
jgi:hypothetical protein